MKSGIIYLLTNMVNGKQYAGQTIDINKRMSAHRSKRELVVERAIDKYSWDSFEVKILEDNIPESKLDEKEIKYIAKYNTYHNGYNCAPGGEGFSRGKNHPMWGKTGKDTPMWGKEHTKKAKQKMSESSKGKELSKEHKKQISNATKGENNPQSQLTKKDVKGIKWLLIGDNFTYKQVGQIYGVAKSTISMIAIDEIWQHVKLDRSIQHT